MKKKGFTLIELLVVIAIIGILATIVVVVTRGARDATRDARIMTQLSQARSAAEVYYSQNAYEYDGMCPTMNPAGTEYIAPGDGDLITLFNDIFRQNGSAALICHADGDDYCISTEMASDDRDDVCISSDGTIQEGFRCSVVAPTAGTCVVIGP